jgi:hypothetical protein
MKILQSWEKPRRHGIKHIALCLALGAIVWLGLVYSVINSYDIGDASLEVQAEYLNERNK